MKVIDCAVTQSDTGQSKSLDNLLGSLKIGRGWSGEAEAQEIVIAAFQQITSNKYFMLRNLHLAGLEMPVPLVLAGPAGIWVLYPSRLRGVFRAKGDSWEKIDDRKQTYTPAEENLLSRTQLLARAVKDFLASHGVMPSQVEPVLVFTNPGIHIETVRPIVRIVLVDALNRFISGIVRSRVIYDQEQVQNIVDLLTIPPDASSDPGADGQGGFAIAAQERMESATANLERFDNAFSKVEKLPFSSRQWVVLGGLILINIIILVAFVVYILFSN
jgi:hypothetical protein